MTKARKIIVTVLAALLIVSALILAVQAAVPAQAQILVADTISYSDVKYKTAQQDDRGEKALVLYSYESNATATWKNVFVNSFDIDLRAYTQGAVSPNLSKYSLVFENAINGEKFSVIVEDGGNTKNVCVEINGEKCGIVYYSDDEGTVDTNRGFTTGYNANGVYTSFDSTSLALSFNAETMQVYAQTEDGTSFLVWDMSKPINDGKNIGITLDSMLAFKVSVVFDSVKKSSKNELFVYSVNGTQLNKSYVEQTAPSVWADFTQNAVVGESYAVPTPFATDVKKGSLSLEDISMGIYDADGNILHSATCSDNMTYKFDREGVFFFAFSATQNGRTGYALYKINALAKNSVHTSVVTEGEFENVTIGKNTILSIPAAKLYPNILLDSDGIDATAVISKDGREIVSSSETFSYKFSETGNYTVVYADKNNEYSCSFTVTVSDSVLGLDLPIISQTYNVGDTLDIGVCKAYQNGNVYDAKLTLDYPDGTQQSGESFALDMVGNYTLNIEFDGNKETRQFTVNYTPQSLVTATDATARFSQLAGNSEMSGLLLTLNRGGSVTYNKVLDLSQNTKDDLLIEMMAQPKKTGEIDMDGFVITLTDIYDETNYVRIRVVAGTDSYTDRISFVRAAASNQSYAGLEYSWDSSVKPNVVNSSTFLIGGYVTMHNFQQTLYPNVSLSDYTFKLYYDNDTKQIHSVGQDGNGAQGSLVIDLDDPEHFSGGWAGFTTGEVYLSISGLGISTTADVMIFNINGTSLSESSVEDTVGPNVSVDYDGNDSAPDAKVGSPYKIFDVVATDFLSSVKSKEVNVWFGDEKISVENGYFTPTRTGTYTLEYIVKDAYGNATVTTVLVNAKSAFDKVTIDDVQRQTLSACYGETMHLPQISADGGSGVKKLSASVYYKSSDNKVAEFDLTDTENGAYYVFMNTGTYYIQFKATDYIADKAGTASAVWTVNVSYVNMPVFDESQLSLPNGFVEGVSYTFDSYSGVYYSDETDTVGTEVLAQIRVVDGSGTSDINGEYTPVAFEDGSDATVLLIFERNGAETLTVEKKLPLIRAEKESGFIAKYFVTEGVDDSATAGTAQSIKFTALNNASSMKIAFAKSVGAEEFTLEFNSDSDSNNFKSVSVVLRDKYNSKQTFKVTYVQGSTLTASLNGGRYISTGGSLESDFYVSLNFNNKTLQITDSLGSVFATVNETFDGEEFNGFDSKEVYVEITVEGIDGNCAIWVSKINNQIISSRNTDGIRPEIFIDGNCNGQYAYGETVTIPSARAYDVLSSCSEVTVSVSTTDDNGNTIFAVASDGTVLDGTASAAVEYRITPDYGVYSVLYTATDGSSRRATDEQIVSVVDNEAPTLQLKSSMPTTAKVGQTITLPEVLASDNRNGEVTIVISVIDSVGISRIVTDGKFTFDSAGTYRVNILLLDEAFNAALYTYEIVVK